MTTAGHRFPLWVRIFGSVFCAILFLSLLYVGVDRVGEIVEHFTHD